MSDLELSTKTRDLLRAAKGDAPNALSKAKIWGGVAATTAGAAGAGTSVALAVSGGSGKLVAVGALFGSAITVGLAMALMHVGPLSPNPGSNASRGADARMSSAPQPQRDEYAPALPIMPPPPAAPTAPATLVDAKAAPPSVAANAAPPAAPKPAVRLGASVAAKAKPSATDSDDVLMRETLLVAEARGALMRGDARAALSAARAARALDSHALDPEELSLQARALRALGEDDEANKVEGTLKGRYPEHALSR